jgi:hypothetical protein
LQNAYPAIIIVGYMNAENQSEDSSGNDGDKISDGFSRFLSLFDEGQSFDLMQDGIKCGMISVIQSAEETVLMMVQIASPDEGKLTDEYFYHARQITIPEIIQTMSKAKAKINREQKAHGAKKPKKKRGKGKGDIE